MRSVWMTLMAAAACVTACSSSTTMTPADLAPATHPIAVPAEPQRTGDATAGYHALVNNGYVGCGIPYSLYSQVFGMAPATDQLPGRDGHNATLPYGQTAFTQPSGVEVVTANCLSCHAAKLGGKVIVGLGTTSQDFTQDPSSQIELAGMLLGAGPEKTEWRKFADRVEAVGPYATTLTTGVTAADNIAAVLFAHRDASTLAWSATPILELPPPSQAPGVPVDVPPWWRLAKKNAMFYDGAGRGDQARIMMTASTLCTDDVASAQAIDAYFGDVRAYLLSLVPPPYPLAVDAALAARGRGVFEHTCSECHGTYGDGGAYPNLLIPVGEVGTDPMIGSGAAQFADRFVQWFAQSFYGQTARLDPEPAYYAPPLDGIWATAPYLHNGSVPSLATLLDSPHRPAFWRRRATDGLGNDFDGDIVGFAYDVVDHGQDAEPDASLRRRIYDTTRMGYGNGGHTYGDALAPDDRAALLEYLKTL
jgi:mono/diheme cytochrome c family protein